MFQTFSSGRICPYCIATRNDVISCRYHNIKSFKKRDEEWRKEGLKSLGSEEFSALNLKEKKTFMNNLGIKGDHVFSSLPNFQINDCLMVDLFHDFIYGIATSHMQVILKCLFKSELHLNRAIKKLKWENVVPIIGKNFNMQMNGSTRKEFFIRLIEMFDEKWRHSLAWACYLQLRCIADTLYSETLKERDISELEKKLIAHSVSFDNLVKKSEKDFKDKPKTHILFHYPEMIRKYSILLKFSCMKNERKNLHLKRFMDRNRNWTNPSYSIMKKSQISRALSMASDYSKFNLNPARKRLVKEEFIETRVSNMYVRGQIFRKNAVYRLKGKPGNYIKIKKFFIRNERAVAFGCDIYKDGKFVKIKHAYKFKGVNADLFISPLNVSGHSMHRLFHTKSNTYIHKFT